MNGKAYMGVFRTTPARLLLLAAGLGLWLLSFLWTEPAAVWRALLVGFLYFTSLAGGLAVWPAVIHAADGRWAEGREDEAFAGIAFFPPGMIALLALWGASSTWAPWAGRSTPQGFWLDNTFLFGRETLGLLAFWLTALLFFRRRRTAGSRRTAAILILIFCAVFSLLAFDLVMALDPHWHSSLFGGYFFISSLYIAIAAWGFAAAWDPASDPEFRKTLGTLILVFSILTTYMMFSQLLPIWYENLPGETRFLYDRLHPPGVRAVTWFLLGAAWLGPLVLLLTEKARRGRLSLGLVSGLILLAMWLERWWLVAPTFAPNPAPGLAEIGSAVALLGAWGTTAALLRRFSVQPGRPS